MRRKFLIIFAITLLFTLAACVQGEISFAENPPTSHADQSKGPLEVPLAVSSTYKDPQTAHIFIDEVLSDCVLAPETTTVCSIAIENPGTHKISVKLDDGSSLETQFQWTPYSALDKTALSFAAAVGSESPIAGYGFMAAMLIVLSVIALAVTGGLITRTAQGLKVGGDIGALLSSVLLILYLFSVSSAGGAITIAVFLTIIVIVTLVIGLVRGIKYGRADVADLPSGKRMSFVGISADGSDKVPAGAIEAGSKVGEASFRADRQKHLESKNQPLLLEDS